MQVLTKITCIEYALMCTSYIQCIVACNLCSMAAGGVGAGMRPSDIAEFIFTDPSADGRKKNNQMAPSKKPIGHSDDHFEWRSHEFDSTRSTEKHHTRRQMGMEMPRVYEC